MKKGLPKGNSARWLEEWSTTPVGAAAVPFASAGINVTVLIYNVKADARSLALKVVLLQPAEATFDPDTQRKPAGTELDFRCWDVPEEIPRVGDRVHLIGASATPAANKPGTFFYNCKSVDLVTSCDIFALVPKHVVVPSWNAEKEAPGFFSRVMWPTTSILPTKNIPFLKFHVMQAHWTEEEERLDRKPPLASMEMTLWEAQCKDLLLGSVSLEVWQALMDGGKNPINFVAICTEEPTTRYSAPGTTCNLKVIGLRSNLRSYLEERCPIVSREYAATLLPENVVPQQQQTAVDGVLNVTLAGMPREDHYEFRVMSDSTTTLDSEEDFINAKDTGEISTCLVFAVQKEKPKGDGNSRKKAKQ